MHKHLITGPCTRDGTRIAVISRTFCHPADMLSYPGHSSRPVLRRRTLVQPREDGRSQSWKRTRRPIGVHRWLFPQARDQRADRTLVARKSAWDGSETGAEAGREVRRTREVEVAAHRPDPVSSEELEDRVQQLDLAQPSLRRLAGRILKVASQMTVRDPAERGKPRGVVPRGAGLLDPVIDHIQPTHQPPAPLRPSLSLCVCVCAWWWW
jgi:hypothetical protein